MPAKAGIRYAQAARFGTARKSTLFRAYWIPALAPLALASLSRGRSAGMTADGCAHFLGRFLCSSHVIRCCIRDTTRPLQILRGGPEDTRIVAHEAEQDVARDAEQAAQLAGDMIMVDDQLAAAAPADGAGVVLA